MSAPFTATYEDVLVMLKQFCTSKAISIGGEEMLRYSVESSLREIVSLRDWNCLRKPWRVPLVASQSTGTLTYQESGGAYPYLCTLLGATLPSWAGDAQVRIGDNALPCDVDQVLSATQFTLRPPRIPLEDATDATYKLGRSWYALPPEFVASWSPASHNAWGIGQYVSFDQWHILQKYHALSGTTSRWTIGPAPNRYGTMALYIEPWPSSLTAYDFVMKCRPRTLAVSGQDPWNSAGTATVTAGSAAVTLSGSLLKSIAAGSIIRFSDSVTEKPTGTYGKNPYVFQQSIASIDTEAQTLVLGSTSPVSLPGVRYVVSDPIDLDQCIYDAFLRCCEKQVAGSADLPVSKIMEINRAYDIAVTKAKIADTATRGITVPGTPVRHRLAHNAVYTEVN